MIATIKAYLNKHTNPPVALISAVVITVMVVLASVFPKGFSDVAKTTQGFIAHYLGWFYILSSLVFLLFVVFIALSRFGRLKLGEDDSTPEYNMWEWVSMMFTAGMGIGLVYYGVAEPMAHFKHPATGTGLTPHAAQEAMNYTFFHWGLHPWGIYIVVGLALGYFSYRKGLPLRPAAALYPLIGKRIYGAIGNLIDILAVFGTLFGLATSIGLGADQIASGLGELFGISKGLTTQLLVIGAVEVIAITSVILGVDGGIRRLSVINMWLAIALGIFVFLVGPTIYLLGYVATDTGYYLQHFISTSLTIFNDEQGSKFQSTWTLFYWGWWISWSPFVGMFIARISYGYTIRKFILGTLLIPTGASIVWFVIFGRTALKNVVGGGNDALLNADKADAIFVLINQLPIAGIVATLVAGLSIVVVTLFFATSSDSGSLVVDILTNGGDPNPIWQQRLFWAILEGLIAAVLLAAGTGGGDALGALQTAAVVSGLPFCMVLLIMCYTLYKSMSAEHVPPPQPVKR